MIEYGEFQKLLGALIKVPIGVSRCFTEPRVSLNRIVEVHLGNKGTPLI